MSFFGDIVINSTSVIILVIVIKRSGGVMEACNDTLARVKSEFKEGSIRFKMKEISGQTKRLARRLYEIQGWKTRTTCDNET